MARKVAYVLLLPIITPIQVLIRLTGFGFHPAQSAVQFFDDEDGGVIRLDFAHNHEAWAVGQHFFLTFPALTIWQSHPFTVASVPNPHPELPHHTYIIRCRKGETGRLKSLANLESQNATKPTTPVILCGPYGTPLLSSISPEITNILAIAGGTGISLTLPLVLATTASPWFAGATVDFVWIIRRASNIQWISNELSELKQRASQGNLDLRIHIFITQEDTEEKGAGIINSDEKEMTIEATKGSSSTSEGSVSSLEKCEQQRNYKLTYLKAQRPSLHDIVTDFLSSRASSLHRTRVVASGPASMGHDLRAAVAISNDGSKVWKDDRKFDVSLEWDDRMG
jgi:NAD(P)H-flavin reductase